MKISSLFLGSLFLISCSGQTIKNGDCPSGKKPANDPSKLYLASSDPLAPKTLGGFLVFDLYDQTELIEKGASLTKVTPDQICSASFRFRKKDAGLFLEYHSSTGCAKKFLAQSKNQRVLIYDPFESVYKKIKITDDKVLAIDGLLKVADRASKKPRENYIKNGLQSIGAGIRYRYLTTAKGMPESLATEDTIKACYNPAKSLPNPEDCAWERQSSFGEFKVDDTGLSKLVEFSKSTEVSQISALNKTFPGLGTLVNDYRKAMVDYAATHQAVSAFMESTFGLWCERDAEYTCGGARDDLALARLRVYGPQYLQIVEAELKKPYSKEGLAKFSKETLLPEYNSKLISAMGERLFPAYDSVLQKIQLYQELLSIQSNHLLGTKYELEKFSFDDLNPSTKPLPIALSGVKFVLAPKHVRIVQDSAVPNQNLKMDAQDGSVLAIGGIPFIGFIPSKIDESDGISRMAHPKVRQG